jgi:hypothetical protein
MVDSHSIKIEKDQNNPVFVPFVGTFLVLTKKKELQLVENQRVTTLLELSD